MRRVSTFLLVGGIIGALLAPPAAAVDGRGARPPQTALRPGGHEHPEAPRGDRGRLPASRPAPGDTPDTPNPYRAFLPAGTQGDYAYWNPALAVAAAEREGGGNGLAAMNPVAINEAEGNGRKQNDSRATAQAIPGFGLGSGENPAANVSGRLVGTEFTSKEFLSPSQEDGSPALATPITDLSISNNVFTVGVIGDGQHGSHGTGSGDFDWYRLDNVVSGEWLSILVTTPIAQGSDLDPYIDLFDGAGNYLHGDDDGAGRGYDSSLFWQPVGSGSYYLRVSAANSWQWTNTDPASGFGATSECVYGLEIAMGLQLNSIDVDHYSVELDRGDVLGVAVDGANWLQVRDPAGGLVIDKIGGSAGNYPPASPLPAGNPNDASADLAFVADEPGTYTVVVRLDVGPYLLRLRAFHAGLTGAPRNATQRVFLDFDGAEVDTAIFGGPGVRTFSPLAAFLPRWGLSAADEDAVIDAIIAVVEDKVEHELAEDGRNGHRETSHTAGEMDVEFLNSRDHGEMWGDPHVSRIVIGGTIAESGISTIGIASSIDVGNFESEDDAFVLLDLLSGPPSDPNSLNQYGLSGGRTKIDLVAAGVGNITAHEAGHFLGNFHQDQHNTLPAIQDQGGNLDNSVGTGNDGIYGNADDRDVRFAEDVYNPDEGFWGTEDTALRTAFGLSTGDASAPARPSAPDVAPRDASVRVTFSPPADDPFTPVTSYRIRAYAGDALVSTTNTAASPVDVGGLDNGTTYEFTVAAINDVGASPQSPRSAAVVPRTVPGAPTDVEGAVDDGDIRVSFDAPADDGGAEITSYLVRTYEDGDEIGSTTGDASPVTVTSLDEGSTYRFTVAALNAAGEGPESALSDGVTLVEPIPPLAPTDVSVTPAAGALVVDGSPPAGAADLPILRYVARAYAIGGSTPVATESGALPVTIDGLQDRTLYEVTLAAVNAAGEGPESAKSAPIAPNGIAAGLTRLSAGSPDVRTLAITICSFLLPGQDSAQRVLLARDDVFADALAGAPLAGDEACILFTPGGADAALDPAVRAEIDRVLVSDGTVEVLGGEAAVSPAVAAELTGAGYTVRRYFGATRFETATTVASAVQAANPGNTSALLAYGLNWPDALTGGAFGAASGQPILLTDSASLHPATAATLSELGITSTSVLGGEAVVSPAAMAAAPGATRVAGPNRMGTASEVARALWDSLGASTDRFVFANLELEEAWTLALAAAPLSAHLGAPQLGIGTAFYPDETNALLEGRTSATEGSGVIVGGAEFVSDAFAAEILADLQP